MQLYYLFIFLFCFALLLSRNTKTIACCAILTNKKKKKPLNKSDDNYCRGGGHKPLFEDSPSECGGGTATVRYGLISK